MNAKIIAVILMPLLLTACGKSLGASLLALGSKRNPDRVGYLNLTIYEMFPNDRQIRSLALAASNGDVKKIDQLVTNGVDVNAVGGRGLPATFWVLYHPKKEGFKRLLEHGANPNILLKSSFWGREYYASLIHKTADRSGVIGTEYLKMILEIGKGDPNLELPDDGSRPISKATRPSQRQAFVLLYNAGAEIDYSDKYHALIDYACIARNYELALFLLEQGVDYTRGAPYDWAKDYAEKHENIGPISRTWAGFQIGLSYHADDMWFWRCIDFLEKKGIVFGVSAEIEKIRPAVLSTNPTLYELEIEKQKKQRGDINES